MLTSRRVAHARTRVHTRSHARRPAPQADIHAACDSGSPDAPFWVTQTAATRAQAAAYGYGWGYPAYYGGRLGYANYW